MLAFFCEYVDNVEKPFIDLFCAQVVFEKLESRSARIPACCSFEADFVDGTAHAFLNSVEPNFFVALFGIFSLESKFVERGGPCLSPGVHYCYKYYDAHTRFCCFRWESQNSVCSWQSSRLCSLLCTFGLFSGNHLLR